MLIIMWVKMPNARPKMIGMVLNNMSLITIFGNKLFKHIFIAKFDIFCDKISTAFNSGSYSETKLQILKPHYFKSDSYILKKITFVAKKCCCSNRRLNYLISILVLELVVIWLNNGNWQLGRP